MSGVSCFKNEEFSLYLACLGSYFKNEEYTLYLAFFGFARCKNEESYIVFSECLGSHAFRTRNIHCIYRVFGFARFKNEEYTLYLAFVLVRTL